MTESPFPFGEPDDAPLPEQEAAAPRRTVLVAGAAVAGIALAAGGWFFLHGSGGDDTTEVAAAPVVRTPRVAASAAATTRKVATAPKLPAAFEEALGRDPFRALYVPPVASGGGTTTSVSSTTVKDPTLPSSVPVALPTSAPVSDPVTPAGPGSEPGPAATPTAPPAPTVVEHDLWLDTVTGTGTDLVASFTIDTTKVTAKVGDVFGPTKEIKLVSLQQGPAEDQWTAVLQVGDGEPFDVVSGQKTRVR